MNKIHALAIAVALLLVTAGPLVLTKWIQAGWVEERSVSLLSIVNFTLLLVIIALLLYMFILSRSWTAPRLDARLDQHENEIAALRANFRSFELADKQRHVGREEDDRVLRKELKALTDVVARATAFEDWKDTTERRLWGIDQQLEKQGRQIQKLEADEA